MASGFTLRLAKQDFKFSAAHFTIFGPDAAESLHGHNYQVEVELTGNALDPLGLLVDVADIKLAIRTWCRLLDSRTLVASRCPHLEVERDGEALEVRYAGRRYRLPAAEVVLLPIANVTVEELTRLLWQDLAAGVDIGDSRRVDLPRSQLTELAVRVEETAGQGCCYRASLT